MAKPVTSNFINILQTQTGTEPIFILGIKIGGGINWYSSKKINGASPAILDIGECSSNKRADSEGTTGSVNITLSDYDGASKALYDSSPLEKAGASLYIGFEDQSQESAICILAGQITGPVEWNEESRTLSFSVETVLEAEDAGFSAIDEFDDLIDDAKNVAWPMMFGSPAHVPALKVRKRTEGRLITPIRLRSELYKFNVNGSVAVMDETCKVDSYLGDAKTENVIYIENGEKFPQEEEVEIVIDRVCFKGSFTGNLFTVKEANTPYYTNVDVVPLTDDPRIVFLKYRQIGIDVENFDGNLTGMHVYFKAPASNYRLYNYVQKQEKNVATVKFNTFDFDKLREDPTGLSVQKALTEGTITKAYYILPNGLDNDYAFTHEVVLETEKYNIASWEYKDGVKVPKTTTKLSGMQALMSDVIEDQNKVFWNRPAGTQVRLKTPDPEIYIASCIPLTEITAVVGKKTVITQDGTSLKVFEPIPKSYYEIQLTTTYKLNDNDFATGILFMEPLKDRREEGWEDEVFVTGTSSVGPKVDEIIKYLIEKHVPGLNIGDFDEPPDEANFAIFERKNALELCREIAWQARCALRIDGPSADLIFLDQGQSPVITVDEDTVKEGSVRVGNTDINNIKTKLICRWRPDYRHLPMPNPETTAKLDLTRIIGQLVKDLDRKEQFYVRRENIDKYGVRTETKDIYIFNTLEPVINCADYWGHLYANSWRTIRFQTFLFGCFLQAFDNVGIAIAGFEMDGYSGLKGEAQNISINAKEKTVSFDLRLEAAIG